MNESEKSNVGHVHFRERGYITSPLIKKIITKLESLIGEGLLESAGGSQHIGQNVAIGFDGNEGVSRENVREGVKRVLGDEFGEFETLFTDQREELSKFYHPKPSDSYK